jgi:hypothetical protein
LRTASATKWQKFGGKSEIASKLFLEWRGRHLRNQVIEQVSKQLKAIQQGGNHGEGGEEEAHARSGKVSQEAGRSIKDKVRAEKCKGERECESQREKETK